MSRRQTKRRDQHHVRLYGWEIRSEAYRSLSPAGRALLVEFRALYTGQENRIPMSIRQIQERLGISQRPAQRALAELLDRGFLRLLARGSFTRKNRHASEYALTHEPLDGEGPAPKDYMKWGLPKKSTAAESTTHGSGVDYRGQSPEPEIPPHGSGNDCREAVNRVSHGSGIDCTDRLPDGSVGKCEGQRKAELAKAVLVGGSKACPCGGRTILTVKRWGRYELVYHQCAGCGRCGRYLLRRGSEVLAVGAEAQRRYLLASKGKATSPPHSGVHTR